MRPKPGIPQVHLTSCRTQDTGGCLCMHQSICLYDYHRGPRSPLLPHADSVLVPLVYVAM